MRTTLFALLLTAGAIGVFWCGRELLPYLLVGVVGPMQRDQAIRLAIVGVPSAVLVAMGLAGLVSRVLKRFR